MRSLRYWLGLPLFNLILLIVCVLSIKLMGCRPNSDAFDTLIEVLQTILWVVFVWGGILWIPFLTALFFRVDTAFRIPLWGVVAISFMAILAVSLVAMLCLGAGGTAPLLALPLAAIECAGYSFGLFVVWAVVRLKERRR